MSEITQCFEVPLLLAARPTSSHLPTRLQMVSLLKLAEITEEGVRFESPKDGLPMLLTPEQSISI